MTEAYNLNCQTWILNSNWNQVIVHTTAKNKISTLNYSEKVKNKQENSKKKQYCFSQGVWKSFKSMNEVNEVDLIGISNLIYILLSI